MGFKNLCESPHKQVPASMIARCEFLNGISYTADKRQAIADYYGYSVEEYMDYTDKFYSMEFVASEVRRKRIQIKDERLAHLFDIINENYNWYTKKVLGQIKEDIPWLKDVGMCFDHFVRMWNKFTKDEQNWMQEQYKKWRGA